MPAPVNTAAAFIASSSTPLPLVLSAGTRRKIVVIVMQSGGGGSITGATWDGQAMTVAESTLQGSVNHWCLYYDVPDAQAAGTYDVLGNFLSGAVSRGLVAYQYDGMAAGGPEATSKIGTAFVAARTIALDSTNGSSLIASVFGTAGPRTYTVTGDAAERFDITEATNAVIAVADGVSVGAGSRSIIFTPTGGNANKNVVMVSFAAFAATPVANALLFTVQPANGIVNTNLASFAVSAVDTTQSNAVDPTYTGSITVGNSASDFGGTITVAAAAGTATFSSVLPLKIRDSFSLNASATTFSDATSNEFNIIAPVGGGNLTYTEADMQELTFARSAAGRIVSVMVLNIDGTAATGLLAANVICSQSTDAGTPTPRTLGTMALGTYTSLGFLLINNTTQPGRYAFSLPTLPATGDATTFTFTGTGLRPATVRVTLTAGDPREASLTDVQIADTVLDRNMGTGADTSNNTTVRTVRQALRTLRNRFSTAAGVTTFYKEDDATVSHTAVLTGSPAVTGANPPGGS